MSPLTDVQILQLRARLDVAIHNSDNAAILAPIVPSIVAVIASGADRKDKEEFIHDIEPLVRDDTVLRAVILTLARTIAAPHDPLAPIHIKASQEMLEDLGFAEVATLVSLQIRGNSKQAEALLENLTRHRLVIILSGLVLFLYTWHANQDNEMS